MKKVLESGKIKAYNSVNLKYTMNALNQVVYLYKTDSQGFLPKDIEIRVLLHDDLNFRFLNSGSMQKNTIEVNGNIAVIEENLSNIAGLKKSDIFVADRDLNTGEEKSGTESKNQKNFTFYAADSTYGTLAYYKEGGMLSEITKDKNIIDSNHFFIKNTIISGKYEEFEPGKNKVLAKGIKEPIIKETSSSFYNNSTIKFSSDPKASE